MGRRRVVLVGTAVTDVGVDIDERRTALFRPCRLDGRGEIGDIVAVLDPLDVPAIRGEACRAILGEGQIGAATEGDEVVGIEGHELAQPQVACQGSGFRGDPLHQVAVADQNVGVVVHDGMIRPVEPGRERHLGDGHADGIAEALPQGAGGGFHAGRLAVFGVAGSPAAPLAKALQFRQRKVKAGDMEERV